MEGMINLKKIKYLLLILCTMFLGIINVSAEELFSDFDVFYTEDNSHSKVSLKFNNPSFVEGKTYYFLYSESELEIDSTIDLNDLIDNYDHNNYATFDSSNATVNGLESVFEKNKTSFDFYILEMQEYTLENGTQLKVVSDTITVDRATHLNQYSLNNRITMYFDDSHIAPYFYEVKSVNTDRNLVYKIGKVTDNSILKSIKNKESNAFDKLLSYAKNDNSGITGNIKTSDYQNTISLSDSITINDGVYYYGYYYTDDEYYPVYDIDLLQGYVSPTSDEKLLYSVKQYNFKWNLEEETIVEETPVENPKTGIQDYYALIGSIIVLASGIIIYVYKDRKFRKI